MWAAHIAVKPLLIELQLEQRSSAWTPKGAPVLCSGGMGATVPLSALWRAHACLSSMSYLQEGSVGLHVGGLHAGTSSRAAIQLGAPHIVCSRSLQCQ